MEKSLLHEREREKREEERGKERKRESIEKREKNM
jgi:hypothetical protein